MSGGQVAAWFSLAGMVTDDGDQPVMVNGIPDVRFFLVPAEKVDILDTWSDVQDLRSSVARLAQFRGSR